MKNQEFWDDNENQQDFLRDCRNLAAAIGLRAHLTTEAIAAHLTSGGEKLLNSKSKPKTNRIERKPGQPAASTAAYINVRKERSEEATSRSSRRTAQVGASR